MLGGTCCYSIIIFWYGAAVHCLKLPSWTLPSIGSKSYHHYVFSRPYATTTLRLSQGRKDNERRSTDWQDRRNRLEFQEEGHELEIRSSIRPNKEYYDDETEDYWEDDYDDDQDLPHEQGGNYWYNPAGKPYLPPNKFTRVDRNKENYIEQSYDDELYEDYQEDYYDHYLDDEEMPSSRKRKRTTRKPISSSFRNTLGPPEPPKLLQDFYKQFFWYGLDDEETDSEQFGYEKNSRMSTGGTRGKFNALDILQQSKGTSRKTRRGGGTSSPTSRREKVDYDVEEEEYLDSYPQKQGIFSTFFTPPNDALNRQVTSWLDDDDDELSDPYHRTNKRNNKQQQPIAVTEEEDNDITPSFKDSQQRGIFAKQYDQLFQINNYQAVPAAMPRTKRNNAKYQQNEKNTIKDEYYDDDEVDFLDDDTTQDDKQEKPTEQKESRIEEPLLNNYTAKEEEEEATTFSRSMMMKQTSEIEQFNNSSDTSNEDDQSLLIGNYSWQDRADAQERIPPAGMEAWGPQGSLGIDARTHVKIIIQQELQEAIQRKQQQKQTLGVLLQHLKECRR